MYGMLLTANRLQIFQGKHGQDIFVNIAVSQHHQSPSMPIQTHLYYKATVLFRWKRTRLDNAQSIIILDNLKAEFFLRSFNSEIFANARGNVRRN